MKNDGRTLSHDENETIRRLAVRRVLSGEKPSDVMASFGYCRTSMYRWLREYREEGKKSLRAKLHPGPISKLTDSQKLELKKWIIKKDPRDHGLESGLWTRSNIADLIYAKFKIKMSISAVGETLYDLNIRPLKPLRRAYERNPKLIEKWKSETYPGIKIRAKRRNAEIFFLDEAGVRSDSPLQRTWGLKGTKVIVKTSGQRQSINAISAVSDQGGFWFELYSYKLNKDTFIEFLKRFLRHRRRPVILVVDGHPSHRAKATAKFIQSMKGRLEMFFLPPYAPDLNPDEFVWNHMRMKGCSRIPLKQNESLRNRVDTDLSKIKSNKSLCRSFFLADSVDYTTA
jgi:transposase